MNAGKNGGESQGDRAIIHARQQMRLARKLVQGAIDEQFPDARTDPRAEAAVCGALAKLFATWAQAAWKTPVMQEVIERLGDPELMRPEGAKAAPRLWTPGSPN